VARLSHEPKAEQTVADIGVNSAARSDVTAAFNRLNANDREILALAAWEDLTPSEAARVLGMPTARFSVRLHRAKQRLRKQLPTDVGARPDRRGIHERPAARRVRGQGRAGRGGARGLRRICGRLGHAPLPPDYDALARSQAHAREVVDSVTTARGSCPATAAPLFASMRAALAAAGLREWRMVAPDKPEPLLQSCRAEIDARTRTVTIYHSDPVTRMYAQALGQPGVRQAAGFARRAGHRGLRGGCW
jgi:hypothetical protein